MTDSAGLSSAPAAAGPSEGQPAAGQETVGGQQPRAPQQAPKEARPTLPGVVATQPGEREDFGFPRERDEKGRFKPKGADAESAIEREMFGGEEYEAREEQTPPGEATPERPELPEGAAEEPPKPKKFVFAGEEFADQSAAEQNFKSLRGMFKAKETQIQTLTGERDYGYRAATAWQQEVSARDQRIAELEQQLQGRSGGNGQPAQPSNGGSAAPAGDAYSEILEGIDGAAFEMVAVQHGLPTAVKLLSKQILTAVTDKVLPQLKAEWEQQLQPFQAEVQQRQVLAGVQQTHQAVTSLMLDNGQPAFPELQDPVKAREVGKTWTDFGHDPAEALTPRGMIAAVALYRMVNGTASQAAAPTPSPVVVPPQRTPGAPSAAASIPADPRGGTPSTAGASRGIRGEAARIVNDIDRAAVRDPILGFVRRPASRD